MTPSTSVRSSSNGASLVGRMHSACPTITICTGSGSWTMMPSWADMSGGSHPISTIAPNTCWPLASGNDVRRLSRIIGALATGSSGNMIASSDPSAMPARMASTSIRRWMPTRAPMALSVNP